MRYENTVKTSRGIMKDASGEPIRLTNEELYHVKLTAREWERKKPFIFNNSLGYEETITTLTGLSRKIAEQKFFQVPPADYVPIRVGENTWTSNILQYRSYDLVDNFETGIIDMAGQNSRLAMADAGVDALIIKNYDWAKAINWSIIEMEKAAKSGNWDLITNLERSRKKGWDLGIQRVAFLGMNGQNGPGGNCLGLLNQAGIPTNTSLITAPISSLSPSSLKTFCAGVVEDYRSSCNRTAWPTHFAIPESDYNGLASQASPDFPIKSTLELLEETFQIITRNKNFKILPLAYADATYSGLGYQVYTLYNYDEESLVMNVPLPYTNTLANSIDNFSFTNVGYGEFTGVLVIRPLEMLYFTFVL